MDLMCTSSNQYSKVRTLFGMVCSDGYLISSQCNMNFAMYNGAQLVLVKKRLFRANPGKYTYNTVVLLYPVLYGFIFYFIFTNPQVLPKVISYLVFIALSNLRHRSRPNGGRGMEMRHGARRRGVTIAE